jgi:class 3 adenylate cyclase
MTVMVETVGAPREAALRSLEWHYYAAMAAPFCIDVIISGIFTSILGLPELFFRNLIISAVVMLAVVHRGARQIFRPVREFLYSGRDFASIEVTLTKLPIRSAIWVAALYLPLLIVRLIGPLVSESFFVTTMAPGIPRATLLDAGVTVVVETIFMFVITYFLVSAYLERLCRALFERHRVNLGLFYGRFAAKVGVALGFVAIGPLLLVAAEIFSYSGDRLVQEIVVDLAASTFGLGITLYWVARTLTRPLAQLDEGMSRVEAGELDVRLPVTSNEEIGKLTSRFNEMVSGLRDRQRIRETFGKYVSESVASALLREAGDGRLEGETREATVLFTDIDGFTTLSEHVPPEVLIEVLNEYLEVVVEPIQRHGGVVNCFIGDGLFASFNMPLTKDRHAAAAVAAAVDIQRALAGRVFAGNVVLSTRIGINSGTVIGGTIGAGDRLGYTVLGDAVNTASRLQELNKSYRTRILVSGETRQLAGGNFGFRAIGEVPIRGRSEKLDLYAVE